VYCQIIKQCAMIYSVLKSQLGKYIYIYISFVVVDNKVLNTNIIAEQDIFIS
jgi:hypothetical protein